LFDIHFEEKEGVSFIFLSSLIMHPILSFTVILAALTAMDWDSSRVKYLESVKHDLPSITVSEAAALCRTFDWDDDRLTALRLFTVTDTGDQTQVYELLKTFTWDTEKQEVAKFLSEGRTDPGFLSAFVHEVHSLFPGLISFDSPQHDYDTEAVVVVNGVQYNVANFFPGDVLHIPEGTITCVNYRSFEVYGIDGVALRVGTRGNVRKLVVKN
jgi:hypothetical protein